MTSVVMERFPFEKFPYSAVGAKESGSHMGNNPRPKLFYSCGRSLFIIAHYFCGKAKQLPFPFGRLAASVQDTVGSWMLLPVVVAEGYCLHILAVADNQLCVVEGLARHTFPPVSVLFDKAQKLEDVLVQMPEILVTTVDKLAERGLVSSIADLWIKHEADLKDQMDRVLNITQKVPILSSVGILVNAVVSPVAGTVSSWMLKHSEVEVKEVSFDSSGVKDVTDDTQDGPKHGSGNECLLPEKSEPLVGSNDNAAVKHDGNSGKMLQEDDDSAVKDMEHSGRTVQEDDDKIIEQKHEVKSIPVPLKMMEMPVDPLLELFDSTWHMTPSVISPKPGLSPKLRSNK